MSEPQPLEFTADDLDRMSRLLSAVHMILSDTDLPHALGALSSVVGSQIYQRSAGNPVAAMISLSHFNALIMSNVAAAFVQGLPIVGGSEKSTPDITIPPGATVQ